MNADPHPTVQDAQLLEGYPPGKCEWQECSRPAIWLRDTPWGDLHVCDEHKTEPLDGGTG
jgi:hypothetical protein